MARTRASATMTSVASFSTVPQHYFRNRYDNVDEQDRGRMRRLEANLYHYYKDKEGLLFDVIRVHLRELLEAVEEADQAQSPPEKKLRELVGSLLEAYRDAIAAQCANQQHGFWPKRQAELKRSNVRSSRRSRMLFSASRRI